MDNEIIEEIREIRKKLTEQNRLVSHILRKQDDYMYFQKKTRTVWLVLIWILVVIGIILI